MRIARFYRAGRVSFGVVLSAAPSGRADVSRRSQTREPRPGDDEMIIAELAGDPFGSRPEMTGACYPFNAVRVLAPVLPSKIVGIGRNYADHVRELGDQAFSAPVIFLKPSTSVCGPGEPVLRPVTESRQIGFEGELAVVIGRSCRDVPAARAGDVIFGYTCANDVTACDLQRTDGQWARAKGFDTFCPLGPWVSTDVDPSDLLLTCAVNGQIKQQARTAQMILDVRSLIAAVTRVMTLLPGDILLTGTPAGAGLLSDGDNVAVTIEGIGTLENPVADRP